ncbi:MAG: hypothetical protein WA989_12485 [Henriciella sp.]|uniref:hypothetical protein n=1 Tax=Henriciella sp. TaxID=1968823 RepID=UPI003C72DE51
MNKNTTAARKAAANKIFEILDDSEKQDVLALDLEMIMHRFSNLLGQNYTPTSLQTYQSRLKSALEDFDAYLKNPMGFRPAVQTRERRRDKPKEVAKADANQIEKAEKPASAGVGSGGYTSMPSANILPIPLRSDLTIHVQGLPFDLTAQEARKLANVIMAMALPE